MDIKDLTVEEIDWIKMQIISSMESAVRPDLFTGDYLTTPNSAFEGINAQQPKLNGVS